MRNLTSNQRYYGINRRFDKRAALLRKLGFVYREACPGVAVFSRNWYWKTHVIPAATLLHADRDVWIDELRRILR